jgi:hypothetical protein
MSPALASQDDDDDPPLEPGLVYRLCRLCGGRGQIWIVPDRARPQQLFPRRCIVCKGTGLVPDRSRRTRMCAEVRH